MRVVVALIGQLDGYVVVSNSQGIRGCITVAVNEKIYIASLLWTGLLLRWPEGEFNVLE